MTMEQDIAVCVCVCKCLRNHVLCCSGQGMSVKAALSRDQNVESTLKANETIPGIYQQSLIDLMTKRAF